MQSTDPAFKEGDAVLVHEPLGVLLAIEPWNFPFYQVVRVAGPNLVLGNTIMLKHADICGRSALLIEEIFRAAEGSPTTEPGPATADGSDDDADAFGSGSASPLTSPTTTCSPSTTPTLTMVPCMGLARVLPEGGAGR